MKNRKERWRSQRLPRNSNKYHYDGIPGDRVDVQGTTKNPTVVGCGFYRREIEVFPVKFVVDLPGPPQKVQFNYYCNSISAGDRNHHRRTDGRNDLGYSH